MLHLIIALLISFSFAQKVYIVERERGSVAVVENDKLKGKVRGLGNLNHATLKFSEGRAYIVSRDGYISSLDTKRDRLIRRVKVGDSTIGFTFCNGHVVVANYSPHTVVLLDKDLNLLRKINTGSRNVGIKSWRDLVVFSLMDKDEVWVRKCKDLSRVREFRDVGRMPFDALISEGTYVVGFFGESSVGLLDMRTMTYRKVSFRREGKEVVLKIPHFGLWGILERRAFIPAVGERNIHVVDMDTFTYVESIEVPGLPVFVSVSPDGRFICVNYSGDMEDYLSLIDVKEMRVLRTERLGRRIMHFRFSPDGRFIYLSSYYENKLKKVSVPDLKPVKEIEVPTPSGVFIKGG